MRKLPRIRLRQFGLGLLFAGVTLAAAGSAALAIWMHPFEADVTNRGEFDLYCSSGMTAEEVKEYVRQADAMHENCTVYRDLNGNRIKHGVATLYDGNGQKRRESHWLHGKLEGLVTTWDEDGKLKGQTPYHDGKRQGWARVTASQLWYYENDEIVREESDGVFVRTITEIQPDGSTTIVTWSTGAEKIREETRDAGYRRQGPCVAYHPNGRLQCRGAWRDDREHGIWTWWNNRGEVVRQVEFNCGQRIDLPTANQLPKFVSESDSPAKVDKKLLSDLLQHAFIGGYHASLGKAFAGLEKLHATTVPGRTPKFRMRARDARTQEILDKAPVPQDIDWDEWELTLRDALGRILPPLGLEAVVHDNVIWIVDDHSAREWSEAIPVSRIVGDHFTLCWGDGLDIGTTSFGGFVERMAARGDVLLFDPVAVPAELMSQEIDADIPTCKTATALDLALNPLGLTYCAEYDRIRIVPIEGR